MTCVLNWPNSLRGPTHARTVLPSVLTAQLITAQLDRECVGNSARACVVQPLASQTEQTWHSLACAVKTEGKTVRVWGP
jgi:hypothetical protein